MKESAIRVVVHGLGNIGKRVVQCLEAAPDMECAGIVRSPASIGTKQRDLRGVPEFPGLEELAKARGRADVAILCGPSRNVPADAERFLSAGLHTVDSFDIHERIPELVAKLDAVASAAGRTAVVSAGWDPGSDSVLRALFEAMAPTGVTFTNFGRGRSMGHSVAARAIDGVVDAVSITIPLGGGRHSRLVYIFPEADADRKGIEKNLAADPYFSHDPLEVRFVDSARELEGVMDNSHGVLLERIGASGMVSNQRFAFDMRIDNPALTAQVMTSCARAATRLSPGCKTLIDIPLVALLPGDRMGHIARLV
jgi:diaminopimelate dehydrogenase